MSAGHQELIGRIEAAFPDPGFRSSGQDRCHCDECDELAAFFEGKTWREITPEEIFLAHAGTSLLSEEAFNYFLPAYMVCGLKDRETVDVAFENLAWAFLDRPHRNPEALNARQRETLYEWLEVFVQVEEDDLALTRAIAPQDKRHAQHLKRGIKEQAREIDRHRARIGELRTQYPQN